MHKISPAIFRSADIRGAVNKDLTSDVAERIGQAYGSYIRAYDEQKVYVGHDNRPSSAGLADALVRGLVATGCRVIELGLVPTPLLYFAAVKDASSFGVMVTASHLPATSNGFKFCRGNRMLYGEDITQLYRLALEARFAPGDGSRRAESIAGEYVEYVLGQLDIRPAGLKVVVDCQNGAASQLAPALLEQLGLSVHRLHSDLAAPYPFERPDPQDPANLEPLRELVVRVQADLGVAYDGDADRLGVVDERGQYVPADWVAALFARDVLSRHPGAKVIYDVLCSQTLVDEVSRGGGQPIACKSGHSFVKDMLHAEGAWLAAESSGHIFFADRYLGYDDGMYASCRLVELLSRGGGPLSRLVATIPRLYTSPEERPACPDEAKFQIVEDVKAALAQRGYPLVTIDGVRVQFPAGWGLVRASNTEAVLSLRFEATSADELEAYRRLVWEELDRVARQHGVHLTRR